MDPLGGLGLRPPVRDHALSGGKIVVAIFFSIIPYVTLSNIVVSIFFSIIPYITLSGRVFTFCGVKRASLVVAKIADGACTLTQCLLQPTFCMGTRGPV